MLRIRQAIEDKTIFFNKMIGNAPEKGNLWKKIKNERDRFLCRNDLFYLCNITGNDKITQYPDYYKPFCDEVSLMNWAIIKLGMHPPSLDMLTLEEISDNLDEDLKYLERMYLCYRTFYKTTIITKLHSLQLLLNFSNIHICLAHNKQENSSDNLMTIKNYFLTTKIGKLFPECVPKTKEWGNMTGFSLANRTDFSRSEDNIEAAGVDTEITGRHYQVAKKNDLVTEKSVGTEEQIKKTIDWDSRFNQGNFDDPQYPIQDYEGTRYHYAEMYSVKKNNPKIKLTEVKLLKDGNKDNLDISNISNPVRFSPQGVKDLQSDIWVFMCQMMLSPEDPARQQFNQSMIATFDSIPVGGNNYLLVDPASARKKKSDFTVMLVVSLIKDENKVYKYIVDGIRDKLNPKQRIDSAIELARKWNIKSCGWESIAFQETDCYYLEETRRIEKLWFTIEEVKSHAVAKEDRIRGLVPEYSQHLWLWPQKGLLVKYRSYDGRNYDLTEEMEYELTQFPLCEHDDLMDAMTFLNRLSTIAPEVKKVSENSGELTFGDYAKVRDERLAQFRKNPWERLKVGAYV